MKLPDIDWKFLLLHCLSFILYLIIILALCLPYYLVLKYAYVAEHLTEIAKVTIPWMIILLIVLVFHEQLKSVIFSISDLVKKIKKGGIGPVAFDSQQESSKEATNVSIEQFEAIITKHDREKNQILDLLIFYHFGYVYETIYRSQIELLLYLNSLKEPIDKNQLRTFYQRAISRNPKIESYPFEKYIDYLRRHFLIGIDTNNLVVIETSGKHFLEDFQRNKFTLESFKS